MLNYFSLSPRQSLMAELEQRESQFTAVQDLGEALVMDRHPASKTIEAYMAAMQTQWSWLLQLRMCLDTHLKHVTQYYKVRLSFHCHCHSVQIYTVICQINTINSIYSINGQYVCLVV